MEEALFFFFFFFLCIDPRGIGERVGRLTKPVQCDCNECNVIAAVCAANATARNKRSWFVSLEDSGTKRQIQQSVAKMHTNNARWKKDSIRLVTDDRNNVLQTATRYVSTFGTPTAKNNELSHLDQNYKSAEVQMAGPHDPDKACHHRGSDNASDDNFA